MSEHNKIAVTIPKGALLTISTGEYSDYVVLGVFRAKAPLDVSALRQEYLALRPVEAKEYHFHEHAFLGWVVRKGLLDHEECFEWYLGAYGIAANMQVTTIKKDIDDA